MSLEGTRMQGINLEIWRPNHIVQGAAEAKPVPFLLPEEASPAREQEVVPWTAIDAWCKAKKKIHDIMTLLPWKTLLQSYTGITVVYILNISKSCTIINSFMNDCFIMISWSMNFFGDMILHIEHWCQIFDVFVVTVP